MGVYLTIHGPPLAYSRVGPYHLHYQSRHEPGDYGGLYSHTYTDYFLSRLCLGINYDACCGTSRSVPLLRPAKMERKALEVSLEESSVTLVATCHHIASCEKIHTLWICHIALVHLRIIRMTRREKRNDNRETKLRVPLPIRVGKNGSTRVRTGDLLCVRQMR